MKKIIKLFMFAATLLVTLTSCSLNMGKTLLFLNWGEYIDEEMLEAFEKKYNCVVSMDIGESNEIFYSNLSSGTTVYDIITPSDYMVEKMYNNNLLEEIDFSRLENFNPDSDNIRNGIKEITEIMQDNTDENIKNYFVPYLWGTWGIMYSTLKQGLKEAVLDNNTSEWAPLFDRTVLPKGTRVAMYDSHNHAYYAACRYLGYDVYEELPSSKLKDIRNLVKKMHFDAWGTDSIKKDIVIGNLDLGFMWTGDFLYYYCENIADIVEEAYDNNDVEIENLEEMINTLVSDGIYVANGTEYNIGFEFYIPTDTVAFSDNFVIPKLSRNKDLAYKFIDFMCAYEETVEEEGDTTPAFNNTYYVCYDTPFYDVYDDVLGLKEPVNEKYTSETINEIEEEYSLWDSFYDYAISLAFEKYYYKDDMKGSILGNFSKNYVNEINKTFNNARV